jgi:hypothetical protein
MEHIKLVYRSLGKACRSQLRGQAGKEDGTALLLKIKRHAVPKRQ